MNYMDLQDFSNRRILNRLQLSWFYFSLICVLFLTFFSIFLSRELTQYYGIRWLFVSGAVTLYLIIVLSRLLEFNHRPGENQLLSTLGIGNKLTLFRGLLIACLSGFFFLPKPNGFFAWFPGMIYGTAAVADFLDGFLARRDNHITQLGKELDLRLDGLGVMVASILAVEYGQLPLWYILVAIARYIFVFGLWLRHRLNKSTFELPPNNARRIFAGTQMGFVFVMLLPLFAPPITYIAAFFFALPFLIGFIRDWLLSIGAIQPNSIFAINRPKTLTTGLTLFLRALILGLTVQAVFMQNSPESIEQDWLLTLSLFFSVIVAAMISLGLAGRVGAVIGMVSLGVYSLSNIPTIEQTLMIAAYIFIFYSGTGSYSLWKPEDTFLNHHMGKPKRILAMEHSG